MFTRTLFALFAASVAVATPYKRTNSLTVSIKSSDVDSIADLKVDATVSNTGTEAVKILKYGTVLDGKLPTNSFTVTRDDDAVDFIGAKVQVESLDKLTDAAWVTIPAGESVTVTHTLEKLYDFAAAGAGSFTITPKVQFQLAGSDDEVNALGDLARVEVPNADSVTIKVARDVARREVRTPGKRAVVSCSNASHASFISASYTEGKSLASIAASYISTNGANSLYTAYYKTSSTTTVRSKFSAVASESSSSRTLSCTDPYGVCDGNVIAYTVISTTNIYYCSIFYNEVASSALCSGTTVASRNIRGGTTLHELTHAVAGTDDITYGCSADQALSASNQVINADNYNCFSTQVYQNTQC